MPFSRREKQQLAILSLLALIGLVILGYAYRDRWLPQPSGSAAGYAPVPRLELPTPQAAQELFDRDDYQGLHQFGQVPVTAPPSSGPVNPFRVPSLP